MTEEVRKLKRSKKVDPPRKRIWEVKGVEYDVPPQWVQDHIANVFAGKPTTYKPDWK